MKKNLLNVGASVEFKIDGGIDNGILAEKGVYAAKIDLVNGDGDVRTVQVPYKDILGQTA